MKYAISACLVGTCCKYNGGHNRNEKLIEFLKDKDYILVCPEVTGGLPTPRAPSEIVGTRVMNTLGQDVSEEFLRGAQIEFNKVVEEEVDVAILQPRSPSCGKDKIYDGTFQGKLVDGDGIFVQMLKKEEITVYTSEEFLKKTVTK